MAEMSGTWSNGNGSFDDFDPQSGPGQPLEDDMDMMTQTDDSLFGAQWSNDNFSSPFQMDSQQLSFGARMHDQYDFSSGIRAFSGYTNPSPFSSYDNQSPFSPYKNSSPSASYNNPSPGDYLNGQSPVSSKAHVKNEDDDDDDDYTSSMGDDDDAGESFAEQPAKKIKLNKDGKMRKVREPRERLLSWSDNDHKLALMGIIWACGEMGINIPFAQAAQVVDAKCTAGAFQQAMLKLRSAMNKKGAQLPKLKMNWPRKGGAIVRDKSVVRDNGKVPRKKPTLVQSTQCNITTLRGTPDQGILMIAGLNIPNLQVQHAQLPHTPAMSQIAAAPTQVATPYIQAGDSVLPPSTPVQSQSSPVCPSAPRRSTRPVDDHLISDPTMPVRRLFTNEASSSRSSSAQHRSSGYTEQPGPICSANIRMQQGHTANAQLESPDSFTTPNHFNFGVMQSSSKINVGFSDNRNLQNLDNSNVLQFPFRSSHSFSVSSYASATNDAMMPMGGSSQDFKTSSSSHRRDSFAPSEVQSTGSSQGSQGIQMHGMNMGLNSSADQATYRANDGFCTDLATAVPYRSYQQACQQLSRGREILEEGNPFGGRFEDVLETDSTLGHALEVDGTLEDALEACGTFDDASKDPSPPMNLFASAFNMRLLPSDH